MATLNAEVKKNVLVVDNTQRNRGVAASWNLGARTVVTHRMDFLVIVSASMRFHDGLFPFTQALWQVKGLGLETQHAWHCIALHRSIFERVGYFDENFYPAYYEDSDYIRRMELAGIHDPVGDQRLPRLEIKATSVLTAHGMKLAGVDPHYGEQKQYFIKKWGAEPKYNGPKSRAMLFTHPFDDPRLPLTYCEPIGRPSSEETPVSPAGS